MSQSIVSRQIRVAAPPEDATRGVAGLVLGTISVCHMVNDTIQSLLTAIYPLLKGGFHLSFGQIGFLTLTYQVTASLLQPLVGQFTDRKPLPWSLPVGMALSMLGLLVLALAHTYGELLGGATLLGMGSSIFHPESSRIARLASGGRHGLAQSVFQVGGNFGSSLGPLLAAFVVLPNGRGSLVWFCLVALAGMIMLSGIGRWYARQNRTSRRPASQAGNGLGSRQIGMAMLVLMSLVFSKFFYMASFSSYYIFYLMHRFGLSAQMSQIDLFVFLGAVAAGTVAGGPIGDRIGRKFVIWCSILGVLPFTLLLPHVGLGWTVALSVVIGLLLASAFPAILVYATELVPGRVGMVSGLFFGLAFGMGGVGAAVLGVLADHIGIDSVYEVCAWLPAIGILALLLPNPQRKVPG